MPHNGKWDEKFCKHYQEMLEGDESIIPNFDE